MCTRAPFRYGIPAVALGALLASLSSMRNPPSVVLTGAGERRLIAVLMALALLAGVLPRGVEASTGDPVLLNEVLASHTGTPDTVEFVELYGLPGTPLSGLSLVVVEGDGVAAGTIDRRVDFPAGARLGGNGFYLVGNPAGLGTVYHVTPDLAWGNDSLENGSQTLALAETATLGAVGTFVTGTESVRDAVGLTDAGPSDHWYWNAPVVGPDDGFLPGGARRVTDGVDTDAVADWAFADDQLGPTNTPTPSTPYNAPPVANCGPAVSTDEGVAAAGSLSATDPDGRVVGFSAASAPDPGTLVVSDVAAAPSAGQPATASLDVPAITPPGSYVVTVTATNDDATPQVATCSLAVTVNDLPDPTPEPTPEATPVPPSAPPPASTAELWSMVNALLGGQRMAGDKGHLLTDRLAKVDRFLASGQLSAALAQLQAFANQVQGLSPRWLSADATSALAQAATALRQALSP